MKTGQQGAMVDVLEQMTIARNYNAAIVRLIERYYRKGTALDFGAGLGTFALALSSDVRRIVCFEPNRTFSNGLKASGLQTVTDWTESPPKVDFIYSLNVLEHIEDDENAIELLTEWLNPGGRLFIFVPAWQVLYSEFDRRVGHLRRYEKTDLQSLLKGLIIEDIYYFDFVGLLVAWVFKYLPQSKDGEFSNRSLKIFDRWIFPLNRLLDPIFKRVIGKNLIAVARKRD